MAWAIPVPRSSGVLIVNDDDVSHGDLDTTVSFMVAHELEPLCAEVSDLIAALERHFGARRNMPFELRAQIEQVEEYL